jgi:stage V sporulation protein G
MEITEVRINRRTQGEAKLKGYAAVTFDDAFVVRDLKIIEGKKGLFVAMPSQKIYEPCIYCKKKNPARSRFCNECGQKQIQKEGGKKEIHRDIAHPVSSEMRNYLQKVIIDAFYASDGASDLNPTAGRFDSAERTSSDTGRFDSAERTSLQNEDALNDEIREEQDTEEDYLSRPTLKDSERVTKEEELKHSLSDTIE